MTINWTPDRPTKPGEYWLSLHPSKRGTDPATLPVTVVHSWTGVLAIVGLNGAWLDAVMSSRLDGALWSVRETPADPFKEVGT